MRLLAFAREHSAERSVLTGVLALRLVRYIGEGAVAPAATLPIAGLRVRSTSAVETPRYHPSTGLYGFLHLRPGRHRIHIEDPRERYLPRAIEVDVPDRREVRRVLETDVPPLPGLPASRREPESGCVSPSADPGSGAWDRSPGRAPGGSAAAPTAHRRGDRRQLDPKAARGPIFSHRAAIPQAASGEPAQHRPPGDRRSSGARGIVDHPDLRPRPPLRAPTAANSAGATRRLRRSRALRSARTPAASLSRRGLRRRRERDRAARA